MVKFYPSIPDDLRDWCLRQPVFFTASAPLAGQHINCSPKGYPHRSLRFLGPNRVAYLDATGSGCETIAHMYENGRLTLMFCSFGPAPRIARFFCRHGRVVELGSAEFDSWRGVFGGSGGGGDDDDDDVLVGARAVIVLDVFKAQTSCGFGVPLVDKETDGKEATTTTTTTTAAGPRDTLARWATKMLEKDALDGYRRDNNWRSLDGLPGLRAGRRARGQWVAVEDGGARARRLARQWDAVLVGVLLAGVLLVALVVGGVVRVEMGPMAGGRLRSPLQ
ncbi:hypothetical protein BDY21DRAFT_403174 [Lineolata rhizophorae]|uniref:Pyridoxamine phosphate oxidase family protein n=1 Tax=Lineolata rhizophorae TaxID=578093 RepID=A0A6A6PBB4_9PEZI|nr:hypothetical protein BDY21DRAFT_403174 [Lineolata rhizophorae]